VSAGLAARGAPILAEIAGVLARMPDDALDRLLDELRAARRIALHSAGRTGLVLRALQMRLHHLGREASFVGDMNAPPLGAGDLLIVNAATGDLPTGLALIASARRIGARVAVITAAVPSAASRAADAVLHIPAQTILDDTGATASSILPMGSQYELVLFILTELLVLDLARASGTSFAAMRARHANLL
jgi:6-phospho-3-hexuloisomerase